MNTADWIVIGAVILLVFGWAWFVLWLTPGLPPPGPLG